MNLSIPPEPIEGDVIVLNHFANTKFLTLTVLVSDDKNMGKVHFSDRSFMFYSINKKTQSCWIINDDGSFETIQLTENEKESVRLLPENDNNLAIIEKMGTEKYSYKSAGEIFPHLEGIQFLNTNKFIR